MLERIGIMRFEELLERFEKGSLSHGEAAAALGLSERTFRRWRPALTIYLAKVSWTKPYSRPRSDTQKISYPMDSTVSTSREVLSSSKPKKP
jgi:hypothetical protein